MYGFAIAMAALVIIPVCFVLGWQALRCPFVQHDAERWRAAYKRLRARESKRQAGTL